MGILKIRVNNWDTYRAVSSQNAPFSPWSLISEARRPQTARAAKTGLRPSSPFGLQRAGPPVPVPAYSRDAQRNIAVHAAKLHRPPTKMVEPPPAPRAGAFRARKPRQTNFSRRYRCGDLPVSVDHGHSKPAIRWLVEPQRLDLHYYLPLFFDGLRETRFPESMLARQGVVTLMEMGGEDCVSIVGKLIQPIKGAPHPAHTPAAARST